MKKRRKRRQSLKSSNNKALPTFLPLRFFFFFTPLLLFPPPQSCCPSLFLLHRKPKRRREKRRKKKHLHTSGRLPPASFHLPASPAAATAARQGCSMRFRYPSLSSSLSRCFSPSFFLLYLLSLRLHSLFLNFSFSLSLSLPPTLLFFLFFLLSLLSPCLSFASLQQRQKMTISSFPFSFSPVQEREGKKKIKNR